MKSWLKRLLPEQTWSELREWRSLERAPRNVWARHRWQRLFAHPSAERMPVGLPPAPLVLFVCHGNIYRSPMAEVFLAQRVRAAFPGAARVASAGLYATDGKTSPGDALEAAAAYGLTLAEHRAQRLSAELIRGADLVVVMDRANEATLESRFPEAAGKIILLGAFARDPELDDNAVIADPYGHGPAVVRQCYARIRRAVEALLQTIVSESPKSTLSFADNWGRRARSVLTSDAVAPAWLPFLKQTASILMLHRFENVEIGVKGHDPALLARNLEFLRRHRFNLSSLEGFVARLAAGEPPLPRTVVFTVDDGFSDFGDFGAPVFAAYDCPATLFVVTGLIDGDCWLWHDALRYLIGKESRGEITLRTGERAWQLTWGTHRERDRAIRQLIKELKGSPLREIDEMLAALCQATGQSLPARPPAHLMPMQWSEIRAWSHRGISFAPHSHTHAILSRADDARAEREVVHSWNRLKAEVPGAVPVFCYPNGTPDDYGERERRLLREAGLSCAVRAQGAGCGLEEFVADRFALPRFSYEEDQVRFRQGVGGLQRVRMSFPAIRARV